MITEIKNFRDVILYHLQAGSFDRVNTSLGCLTFGQIWRICEASAPKLNLPVPTDVDKKFVAILMRSVTDLEEDGLIKVHKKDAGSKISHIFSSNDGEAYLRTVTFSHQDRLGPWRVQSRRAS